MAANGISTLATKQAKQAAKLALAATKRAAKGLPSNLDISLLPTQYSNNTLVINTHASGLAAGRPWTSAPPPVPTYAFGVETSSINEGSAGTYSITTTDVADGTTLYWTVNHTTTANADFSATSGSFTIISNSGSFVVTTTSDATTEGSETFTIKVRTGSTSGTVVATSGTVTINDTSVEPWRPLPAGMTTNLPNPGAGTYSNASQPIGGTPPGSTTTPVTLNSVTNAQNGALMRTKYKGTAWTNGSFTSTFDSGFTSNASNGPLSSIGDLYVGFGTVNNLPSENGYTMMWLGYVFLATAGKYNFMVDSTGEAALWVGGSALAPNGSNYFLQGGSGMNFGIGSILQTSMPNQWIAVRLMYQNTSGDEKCQLYLHSDSAGSLIPGQSLTLAYNSATSGL